MSNINEHIRLIDVHAHPFSASKLNATQLSLLCTIGAPVYDDSSAGNIEDLKSVLFYKYLLKSMARCFKVPLNDDLILENSNDLISNFRNYLDFLFSNAGITGFVIDDGHSEAKGEHTLPKFEIDEFESNLPKWLNIRYVHRIEPDIKYAFETSNNFDDFISFIEDRINDFSKNEKYAGFKTIIAYRTGLDLKWMSEEEAKKDFNEHRNQRGEVAWYGPVMRSLREYVICLVVEKLAKYGKTLKIHTGIGDRDILLERSFPFKLFDFLKDERARKTKIVLVHGGYPSNVFASYICNALPNVYFDISIACPFGLANLKQRILESIELAPYKKIMYASDGYIIPEIHYAAALAFRKTMMDVIDEVISAGILNEEEALDMFESVAYKNAQMVFNFY